MLSIFTSASALPQLDDEDSILPHKLQAALEHVLDRRKELACEKGDIPSGESAHALYFFSPEYCFTAQFLHSKRYQSIPRKLVA